MRRAHIVFFIGAAQFERPDVLDDPWLASSVDGGSADAAYALVALPDLKPEARRHFLARCSANVCHVVVFTRLKISTRSSIGRRYFWSMKYAGRFF